MEVEQLRAHLRQLWSLHLGGQSGHAADEAMRQLAALHVSRDSNDQTVNWPEFFNEYARMVVVTATSAAQKVNDAEEARRQLTQAINTVIKEYPVGDTEKIAHDKNKEWPVRQENQLPQLVCLRDLFNLVTVLEQFFPQDESLKNYSQGILLLLNALLAQNPEDQFILIFSIETSEYLIAQRAYGTFIEKYWSELPHTNVNQIITVCSRFFARSLFERDSTQAQEIINTLHSVIKKNPEYRTFVIQEVLKNVAKPMTLPLLRAKLTFIGRTGLNKDREFMALVKELVEQSYVGATPDTVAKIS